MLGMKPSNRPVPIKTSQCSLTISRKNVERLHASKWELSSVLFYLCVCVLDGLLFHFITDAGTVRMCYKLKTILNGYVQFAVPPRKGWFPTSSVYRKVVRLGYKSVAQYLIATQRASPNSEDSSLPR